jgi:hypothetical protein
MEGTHPWTHSTTPPGLHKHGELVVSVGHILAALSAPKELATELVETQPRWFMRKMSETWKKHLNKWIFRFFTFGSVAQRG